MVVKKHIALFIVLFGSLFMNAQVKSFELSNPSAIQMDNVNLEQVTSKRWIAYKLNTTIRGDLTETKKKFSLVYNEDNTFTYGRSEGIWELIDDKYIKHTLNDEEDESRFNFGGIYGVTTLTDTTLTLTKLLTSSHNMKRIIHFISSEISLNRYRATPLGAFIYGQPYVYRGELDDKTLDSISSFRIEQLFEIGYNFENDTISIQTEDSLYRIKIKIIRGKSN